jgi:phosphoglycerate kinase
VKRTLESLEGQPLEGQRALVRVDFNVPIKDGAVADATRIRAALPTIRWLADRGCRVVVLSHLGRPDGVPAAKYSLDPVQHELERILGQPVTFLGDPGAADAERRTRQMRRGEVALAENTRFHAGEERNDPVFAAALARLGDFYVNDAFGTAHRAHASTAAVAGLLKPAVAGLLMARELDYLGRVLGQPARPFVAVLGGAKISGKIDVIESLLPKVDAILVGGAMACTFFLAQGLAVGDSRVEPDKVTLAKNLLARAAGKLVLPTEVIIARELRTGVPTRSVPVNAIPAGWAVYDIGEATRQDFVRRVSKAKTVLWNGPMGVSETPPFDAGTLAVARGVAEATRGGATTVVGGGDSAAAIVAAGLEQSVSHISTGGGASLEFLEGKVLPGVAALDDA